MLATFNIHEARIECARVIRPDFADVYLIKLVEHLLITTHAIKVLN